MLSDMRGDETLCTIPPFDLGKGDGKHFMNERKGTHEQLCDCLQHSGSGKHFQKYMAGQFNPLKRNFIEPIAPSVEDGYVRAMQRFISDALEDEDNILYK